MRSFCGDCGSGLFYRNQEVLPGIVDIQSSTLDDPNALPPAIQIQTAERLVWMKHLHEMPEFADIPHPGDRIEARRPILSFFARANSEMDCLAQLQAIAADLDRWMYRS